MMQEISLGSASTQDAKLRLEKVEMKTDEMKEGQEFDSMKSPEKLQIDTSELSTNENNYKAISRQMTPRGGRSGFASPGCAHSRRRRRTCPET